MNTTTTSIDTAKPARAPIPPGWGWFVGPDPDELSWGGPYASREQAINEGNGSCSEGGELYYIAECLVSDEEADEEGMVRFAETRNEETIESIDDLDPCPFCEGKAAFNDVGEEKPTSFDDADAPDRWIVCTDCGMTNRGNERHGNRGRAAEEWNIRPERYKMRHETDALLQCVADSIAALALELSGKQIALYSLLPWRQRQANTARAKVKALHDLQDRIRRGEWAGIFESYAKALGIRPPYVKRASDDEPLE